VTAAGCGDTIGELAKHVPATFARLVADAAAATEIEDPGI